MSTTKSTSSHPVAPQWLTEPQRREVEQYVEQRIAIAVADAVQRERDLHSERIKGGLVTARKRGVRLGRAPGPLQRVAAKRDEVLRLRADGVSLEECAKRVGVARSTVQLWFLGGTYDG